MLSLTHSCFVFCWCNSRSCCYLFMLFSSRPHYTSTLIGRSRPPPGALCVSSNPSSGHTEPSEWHEIQHRYLGGASYSLHSARSAGIVLTAAASLILRASSSTHVERDEGFLYAFLQHTSSKRSEDFSPCAVEKRRIYKREGDERNFRSPSETPCADTREASRVVKKQWPSECKVALEFDIRSISDYCTRTL